MVRFASSILKALYFRGFAGANSAAAALEKFSGVAAFPRANPGSEADDCDGREVCRDGDVDGSNRTGRGVLLDQDRGNVRRLQAAVFPRSIPARQAARAVDGWLDRLGAAGYAGQPLRALSKGMCQKVALAQALLARPGLLVLDEAWTGLDQAARGELDAAVTERLADGGAVLFVDHEQARLAGRISERWRLDDSGT